MPSTMPADQPEDQRRNQVMKELFVFADYIDYSNETFHHKLVLPPTEALPALGGFRSEIPSASCYQHYACLDRSRPLSAWKNQEELADIHPYLEQMVCNLFEEGKVWILWAIMEKVDSRQALVVKIYDASSSEEDRADESKAMFVIVMCKDLNQGGTALSGCKAMPLLMEYLTSLDQEAMFVRALHLFLRQHASDWGDMHFIDGCCSHIAAWYEGKKQYKNKLDIAILKADIFVCFDPLPLDLKEKEDLEIEALQEVGEALEARGQFLDGAKVYEEATKLPSQKSDRQTKASFFQHAGQAYRCAEEYESAEKAYICGLWSMCQVTEEMQLDWDVNHSQFLFWAMFDLYLYWAEVDPNKGKYYPALCALLFAAGMEPPTELIDQMKFCHIGENLSANMKNKFRSRSGASQLLLSAISSAVSSDSSISVFRTKLLTCWEGGPSGGPEFRLSQQQQKKKKKKGSYRKLDKEIARAHAADASNRANSSLGSWRTKCFNPQCTDGGSDQNLSRCSRCKKVWYCSRDCQVEHWKNGHKQECKK